MNQCGIIFIMVFLADKCTPLLLEKGRIKDSADALAMSIEDYLQQCGGQLDAEPRYRPEEDPNKDEPYTFAWVKLKWNTFKECKYALR